MSRRLTEIATTIILDHKIFGLEDVIGEGFAGFGDRWVIARPHSIWISTDYDNFHAVLRLEEWDGEPDPEPEDSLGPWHDVVTVSREYVGENDAFAINQVTAGQAASGFALSSPGCYHVRVARRNGREATQAHRDVLARFDEADWNSEACRQATDEIDIEEEFLVQFWPTSAD